MARKRQNLATVRPMVLVLCAALFAWGLHGKLAVHKASNPSHPRSVIKLIEDNDTRRLAVSSPVALRSPFLDSAGFATDDSLPRLFVSRIQQMHKPAPAAGPSHTYALRFRPPPSTI
jgi:hypothetical protein